jgi:hypothetical protein
MKSFIVTRAFTDKELQSNNFVKEVSNSFKIMKPLVDFINVAVE